MFRLAALLAASATACTSFKEDGAGAVAADASDPADGGPGASEATQRDGGAPAARPCSPGAPFGPAALVNGLADIGANSVAGLRLSPDSLTGYFHARGVPGNESSGATLFTTRRASPGSPFADVIPVAGTGLSGPGDRYDPTVTGDGLWLIFAADSSVGAPRQIYEATRATTGIPFAGARPIAELSDPAGADDGDPFVLEGREALYFDSTRVPAEQSDLYKATWDGQNFSPPVPVRELNTPFVELAPVVTPDDLTIYYASDALDGRDGHAQGELDVWTATRSAAGEMFSVATHLTELDSPPGPGGAPRSSVPTFVTPDGCTLYFWSDRGGSQAQYVATRGR